jgi:hypothetical protein
MPSVPTIVFSRHKNPIKNRIKNPTSKQKLHNTSHYHTNNKPEKHTDDTKLKILQININGIQNKLSELRQIIHESTPDVITVQETKLTNTSYKYNIPGYTTIRKDRKNKSGGGLIIYIKENSLFTEIGYKIHCYK